MVTRKVSLHNHRVLAVDSRLRSRCIVVFLMFTSLLTSSSQSEFLIPEGDRMFTLVLRDFASTRSPLHAQPARSLLECAKICLSVDGSYVVTFLPADADDNCLCQNFRGLMDSRKAHPGAKIYQLQISEFRFVIENSVGKVVPMLVLVTAFKKISLYTFTMFPYSLIFM